MTISLSLQDDPVGADTDIRESDDSWDRVDRLILLCGAGIALVHFVFYGFEMLTRGAGVDENLTGWIVSEGLLESIGRSARHQGQSPLYFVGLWLWSSVFGSSIVVLRVPSMIAHFAAAWQLHRLGESLGNRRSGLIGAAFFLGLNPEAYEARPYSLVILGVIVSARLAVRWADQPSTRGGFAWALAAAFVLYMHPFAIYALVPQAMFLWAGRRNGATGRGIAEIAAASALFVLPLVPQLLQLLGRQSTLVIVELPTSRVYFDQVLPRAIAFALIVGIVANFSLPRISSRMQRPLLFTLLWALLPATAMYIQSHVTGDSVFVGRYMNGAYPGLALSLGVVLAVPRNGRASIAALLVFFALLPGKLEPVVAPDWNPAVAIIADSSDAMVVTMSGYIELAESDAFPAVGDYNEYFNAPLRWHGVEGPLHAIPRDLSEQDRTSIERTLEPAISTGQPVVLVDFVWRNREAGPLYAESLLLESGYSIELVDESIGPHTTRFVFPSS